MVHTRPGHGIADRSGEPVTRSGAPSTRTLSRLALNRALLDRQLLLERADLSIVDAVERVGGLQTQYAPSGYVGLWTRLRDFRRADLTRALEDRAVVQATLMRTTIHLVSRREYWLYEAGVRQARRDAAARTALVPNDDALRAGAERLESALADGPRYVKELGGEAKGFLGTHSLWLDLVRVPPSGTWERRRADRLALAESWVGPEDSTEEEGLVHLVRAYLRGFGPARWRDVASWAGLPVAVATRAGASLDLVRYRDEDGSELVDLADLRIPDPDVRAPVRFIPHFDANLLVHVRRTGFLPEEHRPLLFNVRNPASFGAVAADGRVVGAWTFRDGRIVVEAFEPLGPGVRDELEAEREALEAFHA